MSYTINKAINLEEVQSNQLIILDFASLVKALQQTLSELLESHRKDQHDGTVLNATTDYLSSDNVIELLKISKVTLHNWKKKGLIKSHRIGRRVYFKKQDLEQAIKQQKFS